MAALSIGATHAGPVTSLGVEEMCPPGLRGCSDCPSSVRTNSWRRRMQSLKWILIAMGIFALGSAAISMAPDIRRYARMRAM